MFSYMIGLYQLQNRQTARWIQAIKRQMADPLAKPEYQITADAVIQELQQRIDNNNRLIAMYEHLATIIDAGYLANDLRSIPR